MKMRVMRNLSLFCLVLTLFTFLRDSRSYVRYWTSALIADGPIKSVPLVSWVGG